MFQSNSRYYLKSGISASATTGATFNVSTDFELGLPLETGSDTVSVVFKNATQIERMEITATGGVGTIVKRGLDQSSSKVQVTALKKTWLEWTVVYVTALASDMLDVDKASGTSTVTSDTDFSGSVRFLDALKIPTFADTTARDAVYTAPVAGDKCVITGTGEQYYEGGAWHTLGVGTPTPNASTTVAGKVETATDAEITASTDTGGTGALLHVLPSQANKLVSLANADTTVGETDYLVFSKLSDGKNYKILKSDLRNTLAASNSIKGTAKMATDAEATAGTDQASYVNPKQVKDRLDARISGSVGAYAWKTWWTTYQADTAGFVVAKANSSTSSLLTVMGYVGSSSPATTLVASNSVANTGRYAWVCFPVAKGQYYTANYSVNSGISDDTFYFVPIS